MYRIEVGAIDREFYGHREDVRAVIDALQAHGVEADWTTLEVVMRRMAGGSELAFQGHGVTVFVERLDPRTYKPGATLEDRLAANNRDPHVFIIRDDSRGRSARWWAFQGNAESGTGIELKGFPFLADAQRFALDSYRVTPVFRRYEDGSLRRVNRVQA